ncbi:HAX1 protein, partial [Bucco capensis]|nr:HAX1 protein [Bucco capensis]
MSFSDLFRGFFGFPGHGRPRAPLFGSTARDEDEEDEEDVSSSAARPPHDFAFGFSPGGSRGAFEELFRDVGELLGVFGGAWAGPPLPFEPSLPGPGPGQALRDSMLKQPDSQASPAGPES